MAHSPTYIVTGAAGFIGARFVEAVDQTGATIVSVDFKNEGLDAFRNREEHHKFNFGRTLDVEELEAFLERVDPKSLQAIVGADGEAFVQEVRITLVKPE